MQVGFALAIIMTVWFSLIPIDEIPAANRISDSAMHFIGYAVLGFLSVASGLRWQAGSAVVFALGVVLELIQGLVGYRYFEIKDIVVNGLGTVVGVLLGSLLFVKFTTYRYRHQ